MLRLFLTVVLMDCLAYFGRWSSMYTYRNMHVHGFTHRYTYTPYTPYTALFMANPRKLDIGNISIRICIHWYRYIHKCMDHLLYIHEYVYIRTYIYISMTGESFDNTSPVKSFVSHELLTFQGAYIHTEIHVYTYTYLCICIYTI